MRPERLVLVCGTGTEVGKTWIGAKVLATLRGRGVAVAARKPVQSFTPGTGLTDAEVLAEATGERPQDVCPAARWYELAMAPPMAAEALGRPAFTIADVVAETTWPAETEVGLVETAGGVRSPLAVDGDAVDLAAALDPDLIVLVADAGLGAISAVRLSVAPFTSLAGLGLPVVVIFNRYQDTDLPRRNRDWLVERYGIEVVTSVEALADWVRPLRPPWPASASTSVAAPASASVSAPASVPIGPWSRQRATT